jgi:hypothetical protein
MKSFGTARLVLLLLATLLAPPPPQTSVELRVTSIDDGAAKLLEHLARFGETGVGALLRLVPTEKRRDFMRGLVWLAKHNLVRLLPAKE